MTTHHSHSRRSQNILCSQDCVIGDVGEHVPHNYRDHRHDDSQGDISTRKRKTHTHTQRTSCYPLLCPVLLQILSGSTIDCSQVNPQTHSSCTALGKAAGNPGQLPPSLTVQVWPTLHAQSWSETCTMGRDGVRVWVWESEHPCAAPAVPSHLTYQPEYANMPA